MTDKRVYVLCLSDFEYHIIAIHISALITHYINVRGTGIHAYTSASPFLPGKKLHRGTDLSELLEACIAHKLPHIDQIMQELI